MLIDLAYVSPVPGPALKDALLDVVVRVKAIRGYAVKLCARLLEDDAFVNNAASESRDEAGDVGGSAEVLWAAAWVCGEYCRYSIFPTLVSLLIILFQGTIGPSQDFVISTAAQQLSAIDQDDLGIYPDCV